MNVLLLNQFYAPDPAPTGQFLRDLAAALAARGHAVTVICSARAYDGSARYPARETRDGVSIIRVRNTHCGRITSLGRLLDYGTFFAAAALRAAALRPRPDFTLALTTPPYLGLIAARRHGHWLMDLYPDVMRAHGMLRPQSLAYRALAALTRRELRGSALTVVLGDEMIPRTKVHGVNARALPLWGADGLHPWPAAHPIPLRASRGWAPADLVLMYSGNMGLGHRLAEFLAAAEALQSDPHLRWVFAGSGHRRREVDVFRQRLPRARVELAGGVPSDQLREHLCSADVHLASLDPAWQGAMIPSKLQGILAVGRPVIFVGAPDNSAAQWIRESGGGWIVPPDNLPALLQAIAEARDPAERARRASAAAAFARTHFDRNTNVTRLCTWIETATTP